jgi:hypothetical protein
VPPAVPRGGAHRHRLRRLATAQDIPRPGQRQPQLRAGRVAGLRVACGGEECGGQCPLGQGAGDRGLHRHGLGDRLLHPQRGRHSRRARHGPGSPVRGRGGGGPGLLLRQQDGGGDEFRCLPLQAPPQQGQGGGQGGGQGDAQGLRLRGLCRPCLCPCVCPCLCVCPCPCPCVCVCGCVGAAVDVGR